MKRSQEGAAAVRRAPAERSSRPRAGRAPPLRPAAQARCRREPRPRRPRAGRAPLRREPLRGRPRWAGACPPRARLPPLGFRRQSAVLYAVLSPSPPPAPPCAGAGRVPRGYGAGRACPALKRRGVRRAGAAAVLPAGAGGRSSPAGPGKRGLWAASGGGRGAAGLAARRRAAVARAALAGRGPGLHGACSPPPFPSWCCPVFGGAGRSCGVVHSLPFKCCLPSSSSQGVETGEDTDVRFHVLSVP